MDRVTEVGGQNALGVIEAFSVLSFGVRGLLGVMGEIHRYSIRTGTCIVV